MIEFLLLDLDDTILDFARAEHIAIRQTFTEFGIEPSEENCKRYIKINLAHWKALERKEITREELKLSRFEQFFREIGVQGDANACADRYAYLLGQGHYFLPGAYEAVKQLSERYQLYLVSNGTTDVQESRLASAGISKFFGDIFISEQIGVDKPDKVFFDRCFARIPHFDPRKAMIVGDSLTSDMQGGKNAGIATCWINPKGKTAPEHIQPDYQIASICQLEALLQTLSKESL